MSATAIDTRFGREFRDDLHGAAEGSGCEILEADFKGDKLLIVLDHPDGIQLSHCEEVSRKVSALLDVMDLGEARYVLEVSSPGLDRKLYGSRDYERFRDHRARVTWQDPSRGKRTDVGVIESLVDADDGKMVRLSLSDGTSIEVAMSDISEARLEIEL